MPEGVEVRLSCDVIKPLVVGKKITKAFATKNSRYSSENPEGYVEFSNKLSEGIVTVEEVDVKGKFMYWKFSNGYYLMNTFGMSGQWSPAEGNHPCFVFEFDDGTKMAFNDPRHFGSVKFVNSYALLNLKLAFLGWDPLQDSLTEYFPWLKQTLGTSKKSIGEVLMDQSIFAGVGNYIRAEALYHCKLSPFRISNTLKEDEIQKLCQSIIDVMTESYKHQGATIQTYKTPYGEEGRYSSCFKVYGKKKDPLGNKIVKEDSGGRSIHWCPTIQVL
jgi:DNA-formamidopyrimidine glycosylase